MAQVHLARPADTMHGKVCRFDEGYFYTCKGRQYFRKRDESYHKNRSPKQQWEGLSFAYAQHKMLQDFSSPEGKKLMEQQWKEAGKIGHNGQPTYTAYGWKFGMLKLEWKLEHPYETWYESYINQVSQSAERLQQASTPSKFLLEQKIANLQSQIAQLSSLLNNQQSSQPSPQPTP